MRIYAGVLAICAGLAAAGGAAAESRYEWLRLDRHIVKWGEPVAGAGTTVTYAYAQRTVHFPDARNCRDMQPLSGLQQASSIESATLRAEVRAAFAMWEAVADIRFRRSTEPGSADILIGAQAKPRGVAFADVAYRSDGPAGEVRSIRRSLICLNPERRWTVGFDGDTETYDLRYAIAHEIGHAIGLDHAGPSGQLMSFRYDERFRELQAGDVAGAAGLYGVRAAGVADAAAVAASKPAPEPAAYVGAPDCPAGAVAGSTETALAPRGDGC